MKKADTDMVIDDSLLRSIEEKKHRLDQYRPLKKDLVEKLLEDIRLRHTYHSNAIEGNTLTLQETKIVLEEGLTVRGKPLKDHIEAKNDAEAFDLMVNLVRRKEKITQETIQRLHETLMKGLIEKPGIYRRENIRITGSPISPPSYTKIIKLMDEYIKNIEEIDIHPIKKAAYVHYEFVRIHPFIDGNGRLARLLTNLYLMQQGYPPIILRREDRKKYYDTLRKADQGDLSPFTNFIAKAVNEALMYYLSVLDEDDKLLPLRELARFSSYSQEYLSLRARQGKLDAVKIDGIWYSSKRALREYEAKKSTRHEAKS